MGWVESEDYAQSFLIKQEKYKHLSKQFNHAGVWQAMRGNVPSNSQPECFIDLDFVFEENTRELWACSVVQGAWTRWRENMGMLLLQYGLADLDGCPASQCVSFITSCLSCSSCGLNPLQGVDCQLLFAQPERLYVLHA